MAKIKSRSDKRTRRHARVRQTVSGTSQRPRLTVYRSSKHIYAQLVDDSASETLVSSSSVALKLENGGNIEAAAAVGKNIAELAQEKGIKSVVFDRGGNLYHGRVKALAEAAREAGLEF